MLTVPESSPPSAARSTFRRISALISYRITYPRADERTFSRYISVNYRFLISKIGGREFTKGWRTTSDASLPQFQHVMDSRPLKMTGRIRNYPKYQTVKRHLKGGCAVSCGKIRTVSIPWRYLEGRSIPRNFRACHSSAIVSRTRILTRAFFSLVGRRRTSLALVTYLCLTT